MLDIALIGAGCGLFQLPMCGINPIGARWLHDFMTLPETEQKATLQGALFSEMPIVSGPV
jgi:hypothetical protein